MAGSVESAIHQCPRCVQPCRRGYEKCLLECGGHQSEADLGRQVRHAAVALYRPVAGDIRLLTAVIKINGDLERMGDLAVNITHRALYLMKPSLPVLVDIAQIGSLAKNLVRTCVDAL